VVLVTTPHIATALANDIDTQLADDGQENLVEAPATKPTRKEVITAIVAETGCTRGLAGNTID
jgi:hypothetical protein